MPSWGPLDIGTPIFWLKTLPVYQGTLGAKKIWIFFCIFRGDSGIMKKSNSGLIHPRVILEWPKIFWDILFSVKYVYKYLWESVLWFWRYSHVYLWQTDRQTNRQTDRQTNRRTPHYHIRRGETFYLIEKIISPTHYANFALLICSALFAGG